MSENKPNTSMPKIVPDKDDLRNFHKPSKERSKSQNYEDHSPSAKSSSSVGLVLVLLIAVAGLGANYWLFTQYQTQNKELIESKERIRSLESRLSATGEELDQSAVALQVKVTELSKKNR